MRPSAALPPPPRKKARNRGGSRRGKHDKADSRRGQGSRRGDVGGEGEGSSNVITRGKGELESNIPRAEPKEKNVASAAPAAPAIALIPSPAFVDSQASTSSLSSLQGLGVMAKKILDSPSGMSRTNRLSRIRHKISAPKPDVESSSGKRESRSDTSDSKSGYLSTINPLEIDVNPIDDKTKACESDPAEQIDHRKSCYTILTLEIVLLLVSLGWLLDMGGKLHNPPLLDCERLGIFRPTVCIVFVNFFVTSAILQPHGNVRASIRHRLLFSKLMLLLMCGYALCAAFIGYPQGICRSECTCGACRASFRFASRAYNKSENVSSYASSCTEIEKRTLESKTATTTECSLGSDAQVKPADACSVIQGNGSSRVVLSATRSTNMNSGEVSNVLDSVLPLVNMYKLNNQPNLDLSHRDYTAANTGCSRLVANHRPSNCNVTLMLKSVFLEQILPSICDKMYSYCDASSHLKRRPCAGTFCCRTCNQHQATLSCDNSEMLTNSDALKLMLKVEDDYLPRYGYDPGFIKDFQNLSQMLMEWFKRLENLAQNSTFSWDYCMSECKKTVGSMPWYGQESSRENPFDPASCLLNEDRAMYPKYQDVHASSSTNSTGSNDADLCDCDASAQLWSINVLTLHTTILSLVMMLVGVKVWVAIVRDGEKVASFQLVWLKNKRLSSHCKRSDGSVALGFAFFVFDAILISYLVTQIAYVADGSDGMNCANWNVSAQIVNKQTLLGHNGNLMKSWALLSILVYSTAVYIGMKGIFWLQRANSLRTSGNIHGREAKTPNRHDAFSIFRAGISRISLLCWKGKRLYDDKFSLSKGDYYLYLRLISELIEVINSDIQLYSFSHKRSLTWVTAISLVLFLNGMLLPLPLIFMKLTNKKTQCAKYFMVGIDIVFDSAYLIIGTFSEGSDFKGDLWWAATLAIFVPVVCLVRRNISLLRVAQSSANAHTLKKHSTVHAPSISWVVIIFSLLTSASCLISGGMYFNMAVKGAHECSSELGESIWKGASPKFVVMKTTSDGLGSNFFSSHRGGCNFSAIIKVVSHRHHGNAQVRPLVSLPSSLSKLTNLESLVIKGHHIASDGVPAHVFDSKILPKLSELTFGDKDPVSRHLDLRSTGAYLTSFPAHAQLMTNLETLNLEGSNISCFPPRDVLASLKKLRKLNLSSTKIEYLPPSSIFDAPQLSLDMSNTPVSVSLNWSHHDLTLRKYAAMNRESDDWQRLMWERLTFTLPLLTSLDISHNKLDGDAIHLNLTNLQHLRYLDVSHNPSFIHHGVHFPLWDMLTTHPTLRDNASFIGLANIGLGPEHVMLTPFGKSGTVFSCDNLRWMSNLLRLQEAAKSRARFFGEHRSNKLDLSGNQKFDKFIQYGLSLNRKTTPMRCNCKQGDDCAFVDEGIFYLLGALMPNIKKLILGPIFQARFLNYNGYVSYSNILQLVGNAPYLDDFTMECAKGGLIPVDSSSLSQDITLLTKLSTLIIVNCDLQRSLPDSVSLLTKLKRLEFESCGLYGPFPLVLTTLTTLTKLKLSGSRVTGNIPSKIQALQNLQVLQLISNDLGGAIPSTIGKLSNLVSLNLRNNKLNGSVPAGISNLRALSSLWLNENQFEGSILTHLTTLEGLIELQLGTNDFTGQIPSGISRLREITYLDLNHNEFDGSIPSEISALKKMHTLSLGFNKLNGSIPDSIRNLSSLERFLCPDNSLSGSIPNGISSLTRLSDIWLQHNMLSGPLPNGFPALGRLRWLNLYGNKFSGRIPNTISRFTLLTNLDLGHNRFNGSIPSGIGALTKLSRLILGWNSLSGRIPESLTNLRKLKTLSLEENNLDVDSYEDRYADLCLHKQHNTLTYITC